VTLDAAAIPQLKEVLRRAMALVSVDGVPRGSAFFVGDRTLITCHHVVDGLESCEVQPYKQASRSAKVAFAYPDLDIAVLHSAVVAEESVPPCVMLDDAATEGQCLLAGYPSIEGMTAGLELFEMSSHWRNDPAGPLLDLRLEAGKKIASGMSGGPVVDLATGAVVAVVRWSEDPGDALGGGSTPLSAVLPVSEPLQALAKKPPPAVKQWRDVLGRPTWEALGKDWDLKARVDLQISGARRGWRISMDQTGAPVHELTVRDLGEDVAEALFRWAQRSRVRQQDEVELLGRLLASALIPPSVAGHLRSVQDASVLVRLHFQQGNDLADIPWELAAVPGRNDQFLAADASFQLVRVAPGDCRQVPPASETRQVNVFAVVAQPDQWSFPDVSGEKREKPYKWSSIDEISQDLSESITRGNGFSLHADKTFLNPGWIEVKEEIESSWTEWLSDGAPWVFHYAGVGKMLSDGPNLCFVSAQRSEAEWVPAQDVIEVAGQYGASMLVLELMPPPDGDNSRPVTPSSLGQVIGGNLCAVVLTHLPVHPMQLRRFNQVFYQKLKAGEAVEVAVQHGRAQLYKEKPVEDSACFGWFTLVTGSGQGFTLTVKPPAPVYPTGLTVQWNAARTPLAASQGIRPGSEEASDAFGG
jgi:hypothetical protein